MGHARSGPTSEARIGSTLSSFEDPTVIEKLLAKAEDPAATLPEALAFIRKAVQLVDKKDRTYTCRGCGNAKILDCGVMDVCVCAVYSPVNGPGRRQSTNSSRNGAREAGRTFEGSASRQSKTTTTTTRSALDKRSNRATEIPRQQWRGIFIWALSWGEIVVSVLSEY